MIKTENISSAAFRQKIKDQIKINQERGDRESHRGKGWRAYGEGIGSYQTSFSEILGGKSIVDLLKDKKDIVVVDLMGPSGTLDSLFMRLGNKVKKHGVAVSLEDRRSFIRKKVDRALNVEQLPGDILRSSTWKRLEERLGGRKADLIMQRARAGLACIPNDENLHAMLLNRAWDLLSENNGVLMVQAATVWSRWETKNIETTIDTYRIMADTFKLNDIDASVGYSLMFPKWLRFLDDLEYSAIRLVKTSQSPEKLPFSKIK
jgi:hypothetical protein